MVFSKLTRKKMNFWNFIWALSEKILACLAGVTKMIKCLDGQFQQVNAFLKIFENFIFWTLS